MSGTRATTQAQAVAFEDWSDMGTSERPGDGERRFSKGVPFPLLADELPKQPSGRCDVETGSDAAKSGQRRVAYVR